MVACAVLLQMLSFTFGNFKFNNMSLVVCQIFVFTCGLYTHIDSSKSFPWFWVLIFLPVDLLITFASYNFGCVIPNAIVQILRKKQLTRKFKLIFDNLEEAIFIIDKDNYQITYANNHFYDQFKDIIVQLSNFQDYSEIQKHDTFLNLHIFEEYKSTETKVVTIKDVLSLSKDDIQKKVFIFSKNYRQEERYFSFKLNYLGGKNRSEVMISVIDTSHEVLRENEKAHNELLIMINATVSHELRNPLNSIVALNMQKKVLYERL